MSIEDWSSVKIEVDAILAEYPNCSAAQLAAQFEKNLASHDGDRSEAAAILAELKRRAEQST